MNLEKTPEFEASYGQKKIWCPECKRRTMHEYDPGDEENQWQPKLPAGWFCLNCGETNVA
jgi:hypothetical protein